MGANSRLVCMRGRACLLSSLPWRRCGTSLLSLLPMPPLLPPLPPLLLLLLSPLMGSSWRAWRIAAALLLKVSVGLQGLLSPEEVEEGEEEEEEEHSAPSACACDTESSWGGAPRCGRAQAEEQAEAEQVVPEWGLGRLGVGCAGEGVPRLLWGEARSRPFGAEAGRTRGWE